ncbi:ABC transporter ATP-binding protein [Paenibacillus doosanensis]|uniref:Spermidine/putrescine import ATP-binding protein PotA n=1 Tax=Paenibacillus konkukensis TaxID=2020716 RepID=A0ABY4RUT8_9BACL|nr:MULTISPECIES: ABC transporter ATP-binding protein [Paenibacillus]MCS7462072.1 ABC transporter ATP-binding protein [Paenibacillus doosanensis]UQZ85139.1 Spermidine/putrescine import ATP-binding protein PotA [Paenibacillus konkukensis]
MQKIVFDHVTKYFGSAKAVNDAHLTIQEGEFFTLLGPSGCGKTTLLRTIAGFYRQEEGDIYFGDRKINDVPTHQRNIGMVFQNYAVFPHMTVFDNVAYGLKARGISKKETEQRVMEALEMVQLQHLRDRVPSDMSGGQQQRIALARAIVIRPGLLLMDEPLSNLDAKLRIKMRSDIRMLQKELNITTIYVTHDQEEALAVSDRIAVMSEGRIQQIASPEDIYAYPANRFVANFIGTSNFIDGEAAGYNDKDKNASVRVLGASFELPLVKPHEGKAVLSLRPERIRLESAPRPGKLVEGVIESVTFLGEKVSYLVRLQGGPVIDVQEHAVEPHHLRKVKQAVYVNLQLEKATIFDGEGKEVVYRATY